jgi:hypothetical protein
MLNYKGGFGAHQIFILFFHVKTWWWPYCLMLDCEKWPSGHHVSKRTKKKNLLLGDLVATKSFDIRLQRMTWWPPNFQANIIIKKKKTFYLEIWWPPNYSMLDFEGWPSGYQIVRCLIARDDLVATRSLSKKKIKNNDLVATRTPSQKKTKTTTWWPLSGLDLGQYKGLKTLSILHFQGPLQKLI